MKHSRSFARRIRNSGVTAVLAFGVLGGHIAIADAQCGPGQAVNPRGGCVTLPVGGTPSQCPVGQVANGAGGCMASQAAVPVGRPLPGAPPLSLAPAAGPAPTAPIAAPGAITGQVQAPVKTVGGRTPPALATPPPPQNLRINALGPMVRTLQWDALPGVAGYTVYRSNPPTAGTWSWSQVSGPPLITASFSETSFMPPGSGYQVVAVYPDGRQSSAVLVYSNPPPFEVPTGFIAQQVGPGQVRLSWQPVNFAKGYRLFGPGQPADGTLTPAVTQMVLSNLADGAYSWKLAADYGGISNGANLPVANITLATAAVSGRYLVTITGVRAIFASVDDVLSRDGQGDEIYAKVFVRDYDRRNGATLMFTSRGTLTYGDINGRGTSRVQAGTQSGWGGIRDGDPIPMNSDPATRSGNPSDIAFPLRVYEGTLTNGVDALVLSPSLWEEDFSNQPFLQWNQKMNDLTPVVFARPEIQDQLARGTFVPILFGTTATSGINGIAEGLTVVAAFQDPTASALIAMTYSLTSKLYYGDSDRPIGLVPTGLADASVALPNQMVVLTREIIEAALAPLPRGTPPITQPSWPRIPQPGVMAITFLDGQHRNALGIPERPARYEMYLKVERLP